LTSSFLSCLVLKQRAFQLLEQHPFGNLDGSQSAPYSLDWVVGVTEIDSRPIYHGVKKPMVIPTEWHREARQKVPTT